MSKFDRALRHAAGCGLLVLGPLLAGCTSTPKHTNVLIFGTNTKFALDVSQDATSGVGVTIGYKRQEAVWMPLLPNTPDDYKPAPCLNSNNCPKYEGKDGTSQTDTYSVLASFGSKFSGGVDSEGKKVQGGGEIAQYFATGLAARSLAERGGASLVNTSGDATLSAAEKKAVEAGAKVIDNEMQELMAELTDSTDPKKINIVRRAQAFAKAPGQDIAASRRNRILAATTADELRRAITAYPHGSVAKPMLDTLNAP